MGLTQKLRDTKQAYDEIHVGFKFQLPCSCAYWPFHALSSIALHERNGPWAAELAESRAPWLVHNVAGRQHQWSWRWCSDGKRIDQWAASRMRPHELLIVMQATFSFSYLPDMRYVPYTTFVPFSKPFSDDCTHTLLCLCTVGVIPRRTGEVIPTYQIYCTRWSDSRTSIFVSGFWKWKLIVWSLPDLRRNASSRVFDGVSRFSITLAYNWLDLTIHHIPVHSVFNETLRLFPPVSGFLLRDMSNALNFFSR